MSDAYAFLRTILNQPDDAVAPLIFADWLEESGEPEKLVWAEYIRLRDSLPPFADPSPELERLEHRVRYRIRMNARAVLPHADHLLRLLPARQWTLDVSALDVDFNVIDLVPEFMARENLFLPLKLDRSRLFLALADWTDFSFTDRVQFILNREIVAFHAWPEQVREAINRHYGQFDTDSTDCNFIEFTETDITHIDAL